MRALSQLKIKLFTTSGCHLCDQAEEMLNYLNSDVSDCGIEIHPIEISDEDDLVERYGIRIPVLAVDVKSIPELGWPFDYFELKSWFESARKTC